MLAVEEALRLVLSQDVQPAKVSVSLTESLGCVLAENVVSTLDSPPFDKSLLDGYAVLWNDLPDGRAELRVLEEITAGKLPTQGISAGTTTRVMTGAPIPDGTELIVMVEDSKVFHRDGQEWVRLNDSKGKPGRGVLRQGDAMRVGEQVLPAGVVLRPQQLALLCELGLTEIPVFAAPKLGILSTGDELVPAEQTPAAGQIRNSNGPMLAGLARQQYAVPVELGIVRDNVDELRRTIAKSLDECDVLVLSGGVSAGVADLVPGVLADLGVKEVFHKIKLKPGKPLWFGARRGGQSGTQAPKLVFGLPGNPVSTFVCFHLFVAPLLDQLRGMNVADQPTLSGTLSAEYSHRGGRLTYHPSLWERDGQGDINVRPLPWRGSSDLRHLAEANCLALFPPGDYTLAIGESVSVLPV